MTQFLPCLLERWERWAEADGSKGLRNSWDDVRHDVKRNLEWLLNTEARDWAGRHRDGFNADGQPKERLALPEAVASSVLAFGIPAFAGQLQSRLRGDKVALDLATRILAFEPRIHEESLEVHPLVDENPARGNLLRFSVHGYLRANPLQSYEVMTELDLETGQARVIGG